MAELGVISSSLGIVSLAIQVADSIMRLKNFLDSVREAPEEIKYIVRQIEALGMVLSGSDTEDDEEGLSEAVSVPMRNCKMFLSEAARGLETVLKELEEGIGKRKKMGSFKAVIKQGIIDRLRQRLRDAQDLLVLSNQYYSQALQKRRHDLQHHLAEIQARKLSDLEIHIMQYKQAIHSNAERSTIPSQLGIEDHPPSEGVETDGTDTRQSYPKHKGKELTRSCKKLTSTLERQRAILAQLKLPSWLTRTSFCLEICGQRSLYEISLNLKVYRIFSDTAPIMEFARTGNVAAIQEMFTKGTASPYDTDIWGYSVLDAAAISSQLEVCRLLMNEGTYQCDDSMQLTYARSLRWGNPLQDSNRRLDLIRMLAAGVDYEDPLDLNTSILRGFRGDSNLLSWIVHDIDDLCLNSAVEERAKLAIHLCAMVQQPRAASLVRYLLPNPKSLIISCHMKDSGSKTLIFSTAWALGEQALRATQSSRTKRMKTPHNAFKLDHQAESDSLHDLLLLIKEVVEAGSDLHGCATNFVLSGSHYVGATPLTAIFCSFCCLNEIYMARIRWPEPFSTYCFCLPVLSITEILSPIMMWLEILYQAGIDLVEYARKEKHLRSEGKTANRCEFPIYRRDMSFCDERSRWFSINFEYGPKPSDWQFWFNEQMDDSFAEFWDMVDHPERAMPGAWDEGFNY